MIKMEEIVRYDLLTISIKGYNFHKTGFHQCCLKLEFI